MFIHSNFRKNHRPIGIGGGIVQDITAFTAPCAHIEGQTGYFFLRLFWLKGTVASVAKLQ